MAYVKDINDIPLKPTQETFVDDPETYDDVDLDELLFDLKHGVKNINRLHPFHAIAILSNTIENIIKLEEDEASFKEFRRTIMEKYDLVSQVPNSKRKSVDSLSSPPKVAKVDESQDNDSIFELKSDPSSDTLPSDIAEATPDLLKEQNGEDEDVSSVNISTTISLNEPEDDISAVPIEELVASFDSSEVKTPITCLNREKLQKELNYFENAAVADQLKHLCKTFNLVNVPPISIEKFLLRINQYSSSVSVLSYIHSATMIFKLCVIMNVIPLTLLNAYRLALALIRCLTKKLEDLYQKQKHFATVGGVSQKELCKIEIGFLYLCNFRIVTGESILNTFLNEDFVALNEYCKTNRAI